MDWGIIAIIVMALLGALMFFAHKALTQADRRDDPDAVAQVKSLALCLWQGLPQHFCTY